MDDMKPYIDAAKIPFIYAHILEQRVSSIVSKEAKSFRVLVYWAGHLSLQLAAR
jgi:hypothetical protein